MRTLAIMPVVCILILASNAHGEEQAPGKSSDTYDPFQASPNETSQTKTPSTKTTNSGPTDPLAAPSARMKRSDPQPSKFVRWLGASAKTDQLIDAKIRYQETKIQFIDTPLDEVVGYLKQLHGINIVLDREGMKAEGLKVDMLITRNIEGLKLHSALNILCGEEGLGWYVENEAIVFTSADAADEHMSVRAYFLSDAISVDQLTVALPQVILPETWQASDGASISQVASCHMLLVRQNRMGHDMIESLLQQLYEATQQTSNTN